MTGETVAERFSRLTGRDTRPERIVFVVEVAGGGSLVDEAGGHGTAEVPAAAESGRAAACREAAAGGVAAEFRTAAACRGTQTADCPAAAGVSKRKSRRRCEGDGGEARVVAAV